jgi:hypothetical protein
MVFSGHLCRACASTESSSTMDSIRYRGPCKRRTLATATGDTWLTILVSANIQHQPQGAFMCFLSANDRYQRLCAGVSPEDAGPPRIAGQDARADDRHPDHKFGDRGSADSDCDDIAVNHRMRLKLSQMYTARICYGVLYVGKIVIFIRIPSGRTLFPPQLRRYLRRVRS